MCDFEKMDSNEQRLGSPLLKTNKGPRLLNNHLETKALLISMVLAALPALVLSSCGSQPNAQAAVSTTTIGSSTTNSAPTTTTSTVAPTTTTAPPTETVQAPGITGPLVLHGNGFGGIHFGQAESLVIPKLVKLLGSSGATAPASATGNCTIDSYLKWPGITVYFYHQVFVGYSTGSFVGRQRKILNVVSAKGLRIGDTLRSAERIYGSSLSTSFAQGGSWFATTPTGRLAGYLTAEVNQQTPPPLIADITAGSVGCPAASP